MVEEEESSESKENKYINYPSLSILLIDIFGLFFISFCMSIISIIRNKQKLNINISFIEYLELFTSGVYFSFSLINMFLEIENNELNNNVNTNKYLLLFLCLGYIYNYFCENILIQLQIKNRRFIRRYSSLINNLIKNNDNKNDNISISSFDLSDSNKDNSLEDVSSDENIIEKRFSTGGNYYFNIFNDKIESLEKEKELEKKSYDFTRKLGIQKINNIFIFEKLINKNNENKIYEQVYNEKNIYSIGTIIILNMHKLCQGLYIGIIHFEYKYFTQFSLLIYYFAIIDSFHIGITLSKFQIEKRELSIYIFIISVLYFVGGLIGLLLKLIFNSFIQKMILFFIIGTFLYLSFNILDNYFYHIDKDENKIKDFKGKYYFYFFIFGLAIYLFIFYLFK